MDLSKKTLIELRELAKENGIKGVTALRKPELIERLDREFAQREKKAQPQKKTVTQNRTVSKPVERKIPRKSSAPQYAPASQETARPEAKKTENGWPRRNTRPSFHSAGGYNHRQTEPRGQERYSRPQDNAETDYREHRVENAYSREQQRMERTPEHYERPAEPRAERNPQNHAYNNTNNPQNNTQPAANYYNNYNQQKLQYHDGTDGLISIVKDRQIAEVTPTEIKDLDSGITKKGILEIMAEGYGFIRCDNFLPGENDVYVAPQFIRRFGLRTGDIVEGNLRTRTMNEKFSALLYMKKVNDRSPSYLYTREKFEDLTPVFPDSRIHLETPSASISMRMLDLIAPIGKGQRGMIVSQPKTGKTTLLKQVARAVNHNYPKMHLLILLIDERPEEVTDIKESIEGENVEVIYSTFDELPENHKRVSEMVIERAKRLVEGGDDVMILLDSITRLARAYNLTVTPSGRTLSGGLDPAALHMPKRFFGAARNMRESGSLTILATALVDTGSRMDDVVFEEFKGTGNMELVLDRSLSEKRIFPAIDIQKSSTRREDLLLNVSEQEAVIKIRKALGGLKSEQALEQILNLFRRTKDNNEFIETVKKMHL